MSPCDYDYMDFLQVRFLLYLKYLAIFIKENDVIPIDGFCDQLLFGILMIINSS